jgi:MFS transporter, DHA2 family, multidrug resistance protein
LMFTSLTTVSMLEIPREKMAQASAITNSIRQLGGSLGVAFLATMLTARVTYHSQIFSESVKPGTELYQKTIGNMKHHIVYEAGAAPSNATRLGQSMLLTNLGKQAYIEGINDDFLIAGLITLTGLIPVFFLHTKKKKSNTENIVTHE